MRVKTRSRKTHGRLISAALVAILAPCMAFAALDIEIQPAAEAPVHLISPKAEVSLKGHDEAWISWGATRDLVAQDTREWEAFLSFDGGREWPVRITPHLDIACSGFRFVVPGIPSDDVRLMLRFGDEEHEVGYLMPQKFRITAPQFGWRVPPIYRPVIGRGEVARPGVSGVVVWAEGRRNGLWRGAMWRGDHRIRKAHTAWLPFLFVLNAPSHEPVVQPADAGVHPRVQTLGSAGPQGSFSLVFCALLSLLCRRNE